MTTQTDDPVVDTTPQQPVEGQQSSGSTGGQKVDYEARFKGMQGAYEKLKQQSERTILDLQARLSDAQATIESQAIQIKELTAKLEAATNEKTNFEKTLTETKTEAQKAAFKVERMKFIAEQFPEFVALEASGNLPEAESLDDLKVKLESQRKVLQGLVEQIVKQKLAGTSQPIGSTAGGATDPKSGQKRDKATVWEEMKRYRNATTEEGKAKYAQLLVEWESLFD